MFNVLVEKICYAQYDAKQNPVSFATIGPGRKSWSRIQRLENTRPISPHMQYNKKAVWLARLIIILPAGQTCNDGQTLCSFIITTAGQSLFTKLSISSKRPEKPSF